MSAFAQQYMADFKPSENEAQLQQLAARYVEETEAYDQTVCTGPMGRDGIMPATPRERSLITRNAAATLDRLARENAHQFTRADLRRAIGRYEQQGFRA